MVRPGLTYGNDLSMESVLKKIGREFFYGTIDRCFEYIALFVVVFTIWNRSVPRDILDLYI